MRQIIGVAIAAAALALAARAPAEADASRGSIVRAVAQTGGLAPHWAGYAVTRTQTQPMYRNVLGMFIVPKATCVDNLKAVDQVLVWAGLGGISSGDILYQDGIGVQCNNGKPSYYAWWEEYPLNKIQVISDRTGKLLPVKPGDLIYAAVYYDTSQGQQILYDLEDWAPDGSVDHWAWVDQRVAAPSAPLSAECILERPPLPSNVSNQGLATLPKFTKVAFNRPGVGCQVVKFDPSLISPPQWDITQKAATFATPLPWSAGVFTMWNPNTGDLLAKTAPRGGGGTITWKASL